MQEIPDYRRFHYLEDLIVMQAVFEKRLPQETLAKLDRLQQWITEDSFSISAVLSSGSWTIA